MEVHEGTGPVKIYKNDTSTRIDLWKEISHDEAHPPVYSWFRIGKMDDVSEATDVTTIPRADWTIKVSDGLLEFTAIPNPTFEKIT